VWLGYWAPPQEASIIAVFGRTYLLRVIIQHTSSQKCM
jgi:hypothetical protein